MVRQSTLALRLFLLRFFTRLACLALVPDRAAAATFQIELPPGGFDLRVAPGAEIEVKLGRFADAPVVALGSATGPSEVAIPRDASPTPWRAELATETRALACHR